MEFRQSFFDASNGFDQEVFAGGITQADAAVVAEGGAHDSGNVCLVEKVESHIGAILDFFAIKAFAVV